MDERECTCENCNICVEHYRDVLHSVAQALLDGGGPFQHFVPGSEASRLQQAVDQAHRLIAGALRKKGTS